MKLSLPGRTGFRRALADVLGAGLLLTLLGYLVTPLFGSPWPEITSYLTLGLYAYAAWRLSPGSGGPVRRLARIAAWAALVTLVVWAMALVCLKFGLHTGSFFGVNLADAHPSPGALLFSSIIATLSPFVLARTLLTLWDAGRTGLRWRLTYSYLVIALLALLLIVVAQSVYLGLYSLVAAPTLLDPSVAARRAADAVQPLVQQGASTEQLAGVLKGLLDGSVRLPMPSGQVSDDGAAPPEFAGVRRLSVLRPDGQVIASAGENAPASGSPLPAAQQTKLAPLLARVRAGGCSNARPAGGPRSDTAACAMVDGKGAPVSLLLVESNTDSVAQFQADFNRIVTMVVLSTASAVYLMLIAVGGILVIAGGGGYLLSRRLSKKLERLAAATGSLSAGNLSRRVAVDSADEIGKLSADFNTMAARLEEREAALTAEKNRAERLLTANRRLVADISHELRTPLATMRGYIEQLELEHGDHLPAHDLGVIQAEMGRLTTLIEDLFTLARAEAQQLPLNLEAVDAGAVATHLAETLAPLARRERQIEIVTALPANLPCVRADRVRLEQVVLNLLQNALRYTLPGGIIAVEGSADDGVVTLAVDDTGVGIPSEELPLVFERFYRSDSSRARESGGAGIGLALVSELTAAMGGSVSVQSTPGRGSRFSIALPQADERGHSRTED